MVDGKIIAIARLACRAFRFGVWCLQQDSSVAASWLPLRSDPQYLSPRSRRQNWRLGGLLRFFDRCSCSSCCVQTHLVRGLCHGWIDRRARRETARRHLARSTINSKFVASRRSVICGRNSADGPRPAVHPAPRAGVQGERRVHAYNQVAPDVLETCAKRSRSDRKSLQRCYLFVPGIEQRHAE